MYTPENSSGYALSTILQELSFPVQGHRQCREFDLFSSVKLIKCDVKESQGLRWAYLRRCLTSFE
jgi:hypothetical protein